MSYSVTFCNYTIGNDAYEQVARICSPYGRRILLVHGRRAYAAAGAQLAEAIRDSGLVIAAEAVYGSEKAMDCTMENIAAMAKLARECQADMIWGMGGGKALDTAKGCGDSTGLPVFTFPTIAATCAATTALSVVYREDGSFEKFLFYQKPAVHCFIHTEIIANAPAEYLRAGMGDTIGKAFECQFAARGDQLTHSSALGHAISSLCWQPLLDYGEAALQDCIAKQPTLALEQAILAVVVSTGLVSLLVLDQYNGAIAHSVYYGLCLLPGFEEENLHGDVVGYGVLVQLAIDQDYEEMKKVLQFLRALGIKASLQEMGVSSDRSNLEDVLTEILAGPDMEHLPYAVDREMVYQAMCRVEELCRSQN